LGVVSLAGLADCGGGSTNGIVPSVVRAGVLSVGGSGHHWDKAQTPITSNRMTIAVTPNRRHRRPDPGCLAVARRCCVPALL